MCAAYVAVRAGLGTLLSEWSNLHIVASASNFSELETALESETPDVVLYDFNPSERENVLRLLSEKGLPAVIMADTPEIVTTLAQSGLPSWAAICKNADGDEIIQAVHTVHAGLIAADQSLILPLLRNRTKPVSSAARDLFPDEHLTPREQEVLQLMAEGLPNKVIAARLKVSLHTAKFHVASILAKLGASSRTEAVTLGARRGDILL